MIIHLILFKADANTWQNSFVKILLPTNQKSQNSGYWPIPDYRIPFQISDFQKMTPIRDSIPTIGFVVKKVDAIHHDQFPFDKYELAPCAFTRYVLANVSPNKCWQLFLMPGSEPNIDGPLTPPPNGQNKISFGYIKSSINQQSVKLFLMPYNYPALLPLIGN